MRLPVTVARAANFNPRSPHGERRRLCLIAQSPAYFNPRSPHGERRSGRFPQQSGQTAFQPTLPARGATLDETKNIAIVNNFNPRSPHGERHYLVSSSTHLIYFNPRSPHGERHFQRETFHLHQCISTHAPRTGSDLPRWALALRPNDFNPRSPHGERRLSAPTAPRKPSHFNPRSPHGERQSQHHRKEDAVRFQPTLPARGATNLDTDGFQREMISTHAPRTGSDLTCVRNLQRSTNFNPRSPHGERRASCLEQFDFEEFQPTLPARGATRYPHPGRYAQHHFNPRSPHGERRALTADYVHDARFQPTLPARGATPLSRRAKRAMQFQPTLPARGATGGMTADGQRGTISTHAPRTGSDGRMYAMTRLCTISTHAPRTGSDMLRPQEAKPRILFQPTLPARGATHIVTSLARSSTFQPTLPARGATKLTAYQRPWWEISTHAPRTGSDDLTSDAIMGNTISTHAPRTGSDAFSAVPC